MRDIKIGTNTITFIKWMSVSLAFDAVSVAIPATVLGAALKIPPRRCLLPYVLLVGSCWTFAPFVYWALRARDRPRACAFRMAFGIFCFLQIFLSVLNFSASWIGLPAGEPFLTRFSLFSDLSGSTLASVAMYALTLRSLRRRDA